MFIVYFILTGITFDALLHPYRDLPLTFPPHYSRPQGLPRLRGFGVEVCLNISLP